MSRPKLVTKLTSVFDGIIRYFAFIAAAILIFIVAATLYEVVMRYFFGRAVLWVLEVTEYCLLFMTFLATAWLLRENGHIKMDLLFNRLGLKVQAGLGAFTSIIGALAFLVVTWHGARVVWQTYQMHYLLPSELRPLAFPLFLIIPIGSFFLSMQFIRTAYGYLGKGKITENKNRD